MITTITMATGFILILTGLYGALVNQNILRMIIAFSVANSGVNLVMVSIGYMRGRTAPILDGSFPATEAVQRVIDPLPQALVLTAIIIGLGITALMLTFAYKLYTTKGSLNISAFRELKW